MAAAIFTGAFGAWSVTKPIPLVPSWMFGLLGGGAAGYLSTMKDARGDLVRFSGNSMLLLLERVRELSEEVHLGEKFSHLSMQTTQFLNRVDAKYKVVDKTKTALAGAVSFFQLAMNR